MGSLFISSESNARRHAVYAIQRTPPLTIRAAGTGIAMLVEQFPWGPSQTVFRSSGTKQTIDTFAPPGFSHTNAGYYALTQKSFAELRVLRVTAASGTVAATIVVNKTGPTALITVTLSSVGTAGNSVVGTTSAATDGDANHFDLTVTITGASGTTTDIIRNLNVSGTGADVIPTAGALALSTKLIASIAKNSAGLPLLASFTATSGADGTVAATDYVGTAGTGDKGLAKTEGQTDVRHVFYGDPGNTFRAACNTGMKVHVDNQSRRLGYISGNSGLSSAATVTDVASYRSQYLYYVDCWAYINDDVDATRTLVCPASYAASVASQLSPSTSIAWKSPEVIAMLGSIVGLEFDRGDQIPNQTDAGIVTLILEENGGYTFEADVLTIAPTSPSLANGTRSKMAIHIASAYTSSIRSMVDAPNVALNQQPLIDLLDSLLDGLKRQASLDPNHNPYIKDYSIDDIDAFNSDVDIQAGKFTVPASIQTGASMEKIFFSMNIGPNVKPTVTAR